MAVPATVDDFPVTPSVPMYCRTTGATTDAEPARARPNPSSNVFLPSATTSSGTSSYLVPVMNSATYRVRPGACASSSPAGAAAASADGLVVNPAMARGVLKKSRRMILRAFVVLPLPFLVHEDFRILVALVTGELPELVIRQSSLRDAHGPGTREHRRVRDRRLIVQRVRVDEDEPLDDVRVLAVEIANYVETCFRVEVGRIDDQRVAFPVAATVAHPELHVRGRVRPVVQRDDAIRVVLVPDEDDRARRLDDAERREVVETRDPRHEASRLRIDVLRPGRVFVVRLEGFSQRGRPWVILNMAVGRIHDEARGALDDAGNALIELLCAAQRRIERMRAAADGTPRAFHVRLSVGRLRRRPRPVPSLVEGPGGGRPGLALTGERHRQR